MKKIAVLALMLCLSANTAFAASFTDIDNHWAKDSIVTLADKGIVNGVTDTLFMPDATVTRAQYLKMIMETTGVSTKPMREGECLDANGNDWYADYLQGALDCGLVPKDMVINYTEKVQYTVDEEGKATSTKVIYTGQFNGNNPITREEMAGLTQYMYQNTITIITNKKTPDTEIEFADAQSISKWAEASVAQAVKNGFMDGMDNNMFNPADTATRAQASTVILRVLNK